MRRAVAGATSRRRTAIPVESDTSGTCRYGGRGGATIPATGEMFVLWDGAGLVVKRVEHIHGTDPRPTPAQVREH